MKNDKLYNKVASGTFKNKAFIYWRKLKNVSKKNNNFVKIINRDFPEKNIKHRISEPVSQDTNISFFVMDLACIQYCARLITSQLPILPAYGGIGHWQFPFSDITFTHCPTPLTTTQFSTFLHKLVYATDNCLTYGWLLIKATSRNHSNISLQMFCLGYWDGDQSYWTTYACERSK